MDTAIVVFTRDLRLHDNPARVAGTGNKTRPSRVMNPLRQARRFDRDGEYVRRYVPELAGLPAAHIHAPWRLPARERPGYPGPIVELS